MIALLLLLAQQDGWTKLQAGYETVEVYRDAYGVPHIFAKTIEAAFWAEGYTEAQDRWQQMEMFRRTGKGETAELLGPDAVASDLDVRLHGYTEAERQKMFDAVSPKVRGIIQAYCAGVNAWLTENKVQAREWTPTDSLSIGIAMARRFGEAGDFELQVQQLYTLVEKKLGAEKAKLVIRDLLRDSDPLAPTTLHDYEKGSTKEGGFRPGVPMEDYAAFRKLLDDARDVRESIGFPIYFGSNAWVVGPSKSATGRPMLYGGPMMGFRTPSICNEIHLVADGLNVGGMSFPGVPGIMIGFNETLAWTTTSGGADLVDVYSLERNDQGQYRYKGEWRAFEEIEAEIAIKGHDARKIKVVRTVHGPVAGDKRTHALRYSFWMLEGKTFEAVIEMNFAKTLKEFEVAAKKIVTSHNFFVADKAGSIGFWFCGAHPMRKKDHDPRFPQPGDGSMDWDGILSTDAWPQAIDPKHGFFANWNNKPSRDWEPSAYGKIFWGKKIIDDLVAKEKLTFEEFQAIARRTAYHSFLADYFAPFLLEVAEGDAKDRLAKWNHDEVEGDPCPTIVEKWVASMIRRVFGKDLDPMLVSSKQGQRYLVDPLLYVLEGRKTNYDWAAGRDLKKLAKEALDEVLKGGLDNLAWKSPTINFRGAVGEVPSKSGRGTYQMTVEVGARIETLAAPGQSEKPDSKHHADQVEMFRAWTYKKFPWKREEMK